MGRIMVSINYKRLFNLHLFHNYYENGRPTGIHLHPAHQTARKMKGANMLFKRIPGGVVVLYRAGEDETTPVVELDPDQRFTFFITSDHKTEFQNITQLDLAPDDRFHSGSILHFSNDPENPSIDPDQPEGIFHSILDGTRNTVFNYFFQIDGNPDVVLLQVSNDEGDLISLGKTVDGSPLPTSLTLEKTDEDTYSRRLDLQNQPAGRYTVTIRNEDDDETLKEETFYVDDRLASRNILGIAEIKYTSGTGHLYGATEEYRLSFTRKETIWTYYIVNKNGNVIFDDHDLEITEQVTNGSPPVQFSVDGDQPNTDIKINGQETVIFKSQTPIPFTDRPKASLRLLRNPGSIELVGNLPNPSHFGVEKVVNGIPESEIFVFI
ncbi:hypothetical protein DYD21_17880 [Rhodohalobacter sp. SW132]|uniref:hypothetical protein n=1 Tax=Rhodohalobacter sp. SW132 TaxID=2293433 RepID=UPI000E25EF50|nr:hypothetical protein [Rhodohalobacter sp. SW132]REL24465.1 hypothetical protein DYD21_17880 [Rhodohalobacter sp. SW132]